MKKNILLSQAILLIILILVPAILFASDAGKVEIIIGTAQVLRGRNLDWEKLRYADRVMTGDVIRTLRDSKIKISLIDGSYLMLTENSKTKVESVAPRGKSYFRMFTGKLRAVVKKITDSNSTFSIRTPTAVVGVKGTDFMITLKKDVTEVVTFEGAVSVANIIEDIAGEVILKENYYTKVKRSSPPTEPVMLTETEVERMMKKSGLMEQKLIEESEKEEGKKEEEGKEPEENGPGDDDREGKEPENGQEEGKPPKDEGDKDGFDFGDEEGNGIERPEDFFDDGTGKPGDKGFDDGGMKEPDIEKLDQIVNPPPPPPF